MERIKTIMLMLLITVALYGQTAKQVLDKTAASVSNKTGASASFTIKGNNMNVGGTIAIKGKKFHTSTPQATIWFDGKTQWTYVKDNDEVNVSSPSDAELAAINPYNFIYMYKKGYTYTMTKKGGNFEIHLKATNKKGISEMYILVNQKSYIPSQIRMKQQKGWTTIDIKNFKKTNIADGTFRFNSKDFPAAEIIDLR